MMNKRMNKKGGFTDIFLLIIFAFAIVLICGIFIFIGGKANTEIHNKLDNVSFGNDANGNPVKNGSQIVTDSIGQVNTAYQSLYWISWFLIGGMIISIFIGSYLVTTKPIFFIPYFLLAIIAIIIAVVVSNAYGVLLNDPTLGATLSGLVGANFIMSKLPLWVGITAIVGAIIMFSRMGSRENPTYGGYGMYG